jgi:hypothetical protein
METLSLDQLEKVAALVADRSIDETERELRAATIAGSLELARRAIDWLPEAFGLVALERLGVGLPSTFSAKSSDGIWHQFPFALEPLFVLAVRLAPQLPHESFKAIAEQSSCVNAVDNALNAGATLKGARISGPALVSVGAETYLAGQGPSVSEIEA